MAGGTVTDRVRLAIRVEGTVQGVGFRPFVYSLASRLGLAGLVGNDVDGVFAEVEGPPPLVREFLVALEKQAPPLARIEKIISKQIPAEGSRSFSIAPSEAGGLRRTLVPAVRCGNRRYEVCVISGLIHSRDGRRRRGRLLGQRVERDLDRLV